VPSSKKVSGVTLSTNKHSAHGAASKLASLLLATCLSLAVPTLLVRADPVPLPAQAAEVPWPTREWPTAPLPPQVDAKEFDAAMRDAFVGGNPDLGETRELVVIHAGRLVHEQYANGFTPQTRLISWSMAKSITQALVGIAVQQKKVDVDRPMGNPRWPADDPRAAISWRTWLQMLDGQRYLEIEAKTIEDSDASRKLFGAGRLDVAGYCAGLPLIHKPGTHWNYNSCGIVLTADALTRAIVPKPASPKARRAEMLQWMRSSLFDVLGMNAQPEFDAAGLYYGSASIYASARDFAKFGLLYLRDGLWEGQRLLPEGWVDFARTPGPGSDGNIYGAGWWVEPSEGEGRPYPWLIDTGSLRDAFSAQGFEGQYILIVPSKDLIVVRLGYATLDQQRKGEIRKWLGRVARTFPLAPAPVVEPAAVTSAAQ
jgi:CubicO group peptidase (beta-lactamase class C family)